MWLGTVNCSAYMAESSHCSYQMDSVLLTLVLQTLAYIVIICKLSCVRILLWSGLDVRQQGCLTNVCVLSSTNSSSVEVGLHVLGRSQAGI